MEDGTCKVQTWKYDAHCNKASYIGTSNQKGNENREETNHDERIRNLKQSVEQNEDALGTGVEKANGSWRLSVGLLPTISSSFMYLSFTNIH